jgi:hypothetical protein
MLTIKHVDPTGFETVVLVVSVGYNPEKRELIGYGPTENGSAAETHHYTSGHAFVMNDAGKTVSAYNLRAKQQAKPPVEAEVTQSK